MYAPHIKTNSKYLDYFYEALNTFISLITNNNDSSSDIVLKAGDLVCKSSQICIIKCILCCIYKHSRGQKNTSGKALITWYNRYKWFICNSVFKHSETDIITSKKQHRNNKEAIMQKIK